MGCLEVGLFGEIAFISKMWPREGRDKVIGGEMLAECREGCFGRILYLC